MASAGPINPRAPFVWHGGDYNPEQWPAATWDEDVALMQQCHYNVATIGVFSWAALQPAEDRFDFAWLDTVIEKLHASGRMICLATPSAAQPAWMSQRYPDVLRSDARGVRRHHGGRVNYCPNSPSYRRLSAQIATRLAERYGQHPALLIWHVSNEYGGLCYCENCAEAFRAWLRARYASLGELNARWWSAFWSHSYADWSEIEPPYDDGDNLNHALVLDYRRFQSDSSLACFINERDALRAVTPDLPITTNMMGTYPHLDYRRWAREVDVVSWDCYPRPDAQASDIAFLHDLNRSLKDGQPFMLMEQTPSSQNWQAVNALKRPGVLRLWSYAALAHGADTIMYFQWRRGRGGCEKFHGAVVEHGRRSDTRVFREVAELGAELARLGDSTIGARTPARVALLFDWENMWSIDAAVGPLEDKAYLATVRKHYAALWQHSVPVDIVFRDSDLSGYDLVVAPMLHMVTDDMAERIAAPLRAGGRFVATYFSGVVGDTNLAHEGYPGPMRELLGIRVEEIDALYPGQANSIVLADASYSCGRLCEIIHSEGATVLGTYGSDFYADSPALTEHHYGAGRSYYIASDPEPRFLADFYGRLLAELGIAAALEPPAGVELAVRETATHTLLCLLNHTAAPATVALPPGQRYDELLSGQPVAGELTLPAYGVGLLRKPR